MSRNPQERRAFGRRQTNEQAVIRVSGRPPVRCTIVNISDGGALLDTGIAMYLPFNFRLSWETSRREEECEVRHTNGSRVGVQFVLRKEEQIKPERVSINDVSDWMSSRSPLRR